MDVTKMIRGARALLGYDICMAKSIPATNLPIHLLQALAEFRYQLRSFLQYSEQFAQEQGLQPRQHQLLLQIAGIAEGNAPTIGYLAERLCLRQNSLVELADRSEQEGLVRRTEDPADRRRVVLSITAKGMKVLGKLSAGHARELDEMGPKLIDSLELIRATREKQGKPAKKAAKKAARKA